MAEIFEFKPKPTVNELDESVNRLLAKLEDLIDEEDHLKVGIAMVVGNKKGEKRILKLDNQKKHVEIIRMEAGVDESIESSSLNDN